MNDYKKLEGVALFERLQLIAVGIELNDKGSIDAKKAIQSKAAGGDKQSGLMLEMLAKVELASKVQPPIKLYRSPVQEVISRIQNIV